MIDKKYFCVPTTAACREVLYPLCLGDFTYERDYHIARNAYDSYLFFYVREGKGYLEFDGRKYHLSKGQACLIDCYQPHAYGSDSGWEIEWIHFDGRCAGSYYDMIVKQSGNVFSLTERQAAQVLRPLRYMLELLESKITYKEIWMAKYITDMLSFLLGLPDYTLPYTESMTPCERAVSYIRQRFRSNITLQELADHVSLDASYFLRLFKRETGLTPHAYLVSVRLQQAGYYLKTTDRPVKEIAYACGFQSVNSFCIAFKKNKGMTPTQYKERQ